MDLCAAILYLLLSSLHNKTTNKTTFKRLLRIMNRKYWIKVTTVKPSCTYYFGSFLNRESARLAQPGFIEDLENENAQGIKAEIKLCQPQKLTLCDESTDLYYCDLAIA